VAVFLNAFGRGDRDTSARRSDGSVLQALNLLNSTFVETRIHQNNAGSRVQTLLLQNAGVQTIIRELFMNTLSRPPSSDEVALFTPMFQQQGNRLAAEGLQWVLLNKMDFLFNY
jgi:adenine-specific DNA methylase